MTLLTGNLQKITEHGRRADGIVKSMLSHSRGGAGRRQPSDINALVGEALNRLSRCALRMQASTSPWSAYSTTASRRWSWRRKR